MNSAPNVDRIAAAIQPIYPTEETRRSVARGLARADHSVRLALAGELEGGTAEPEPAEPESTRYRLVCAADIETMEPPAQLLGEILFADTFAALIGPPGTGKSLLALDWGLCIRSGRPWISHQSASGAVVYVAAEGSAGIGQRLRAWRDYQAVNEPIDLRFVTEALPLMDSVEVDRFLAQVDTLGEPPALVVLDTLARCLVGGDENSARDVGLLIDGADRIRKETGATVLVLHHTTKAGDTERGSSALRGAVDTMLGLKVEDGITTLSVIKQKDAQPFEPIHLQLRQHLDSALFGAMRLDALTATGLTTGQAETLRLLHQSSMPEGLTNTEWKAAARVEDRTFQMHRKALWDKGLLVRDKPGHGGRYRVSDRGERLLSASVQRGAS